MRIVHITAHKVFFGGGERLVDCWVKGSRFESVFYAIEGGLNYGNSNFKTYKTTDELSRILLTQYPDSVVVIHDPFLSSEIWLSMIPRRVWFIHGAFSFAFNVSQFPKPKLAISNYKPISKAQSWRDILIVPINLGIDCNKYKPSNQRRQGKFICGIVGRVSDEKIPLSFFDAVDKFNALNPDHNYELHYYGRGVPESDFYKAFINRASQTLNFYYKGFVDPKDAADIYTRFDCLLVPSPSESGSFAILEAQASGLRVFALNRDGIPSHIVKGSSVFESYAEIFNALKYYNRKKAELIAPIIRREIEKNYNLTDWIQRLDAAAEIASLI